jgi:hypothetical protein
MELHHPADILSLIKLFMDSPLIAHDPRWIQWHDKWGIDIDFLIDVKGVKEAGARFREHLKKQVAVQDTNAEQST